MLGFTNMDVDVGIVNQTGTSSQTGTRGFEDPYSQTLTFDAIDTKTGKTIPPSPVEAVVPSRRWVWWLAAGVATYFVLR